MRHLKDLNNLFKSLNAQMHEHMKNESMLGFDKIIFTSLNIINNISDRSNITLKMALDLGFIINKIEKISASDELRKEIKQIELKMDNNLRGFSRLLDAVLEDYELKKNIELTFNDEKNNNSSFSTILLEIANILDTYDNLKNLINIENCQAPTIIFLHKFTGIYSDETIIKWLYWRRVKKSIIESFELFNNVKDIFALNRINKENNLYAMDLVVAYICLIPNESKALSSDEVEALNEICKSLNFPMAVELFRLGILKTKNVFNNVLSI